MPSKYLHWRSCSISLISVGPVTSNRKDAYKHFGVLSKIELLPCRLLKKVPVSFWLMVFMTKICNCLKWLSSANASSVMSLQPQVI